MESLLLAILSVFATSCSLGVYLLLAALSWLFILVVGVTALLVAALLTGVAVAIVAVFIFLTVLVVFLDNLKVVLESKGDELVLELGAQVVVVVHEFSGVLLCVFALLVVVLLWLILLTLSEFLLFWHGDGLEEVEEALLIDGLGDGLAGLSLLCLLLLLDLLLGHVLAVLPLDLGALALLDDVLAGHHECLLELSVLEVVVLLECEGQVEAVADGVQVALDVLKVHQDRPVLLLDESGDAAVVQHGAHPEPGHSKGSVLDVFHVAGTDLNFLVILVVKNLSAGVILGDEISGGLLLTCKDEVTLLVDLFVKSVELELEFTIYLLILLIDKSLSVLYKEP